LFVQKGFMKKLVLFIVLLFALVSCEEDVRFNNPSFQGMKNNVFWRATDTKANVASDGSLLIEAYTANEVLTLKTTATTEQKYLLGTSNSKTAVYVLTQGSDKITFRTSIGIGNGQIIITKYDKVNSTITGSFKFNAKNTDDNSLTNLVLNFQQGVFYKIPVSLRIP
jgi:flagellar hook assembly protein FlgD